MLASVQLSARKSSGQRSVFPNFRPDEQWQWDTLGRGGEHVPPLDKILHVKDVAAGGLKA